MSGLAWTVANFYLVTWTLQTLAPVIIGSADISQTDGTLFLPGQIKIITSGTSFQIFQFTYISSF